VGGYRACESCDFTRSNYLILHKIGKYGKEIGKTVNKTGTVLTLYNKTCIEEVVNKLLVLWLIVNKSKLIRLTD